MQAATPQQEQAQEAYVQPPGYVPPPASTPEQVVYTTTAPSKPVSTLEVVYTTSLPSTSLPSKSPPSKTASTLQVVSTSKPVGRPTLPSYHPKPVGRPYGSNNKAARKAQEGQWGQGKYSLQTNVSMVCLAAIDKRTGHAERGVYTLSIITTPRTTHRRTTRRTRKTDRQGRSLHPTSPPPFLHFSLPTMFPSPRPTLPQLIPCLFPRQAAAGCSRPIRSAGSWPIRSRTWRRPAHAPSCGPTAAAAPLAATASSGRRCCVPAGRMPRQRAISARGVLSRPRRSSRTSVSLRAIGCTRGGSSASPLHHHQQQQQLPQPPESGVCLWRSEVVVRRLPGGCPP